MPATAIGVLSTAQIMPPAVVPSAPVKSAWFGSTQPGRPSAMRNEKPTMSTLRWLPMSARMRFWMPSAPIVPKSVMYAPPMTGVGIVAMRAPSLPMSERQISITAPARTT